MRWARGWISTGIRREQNSTLHCHGHGYGYGSCFCLSSHPPSSMPSQQGFGGILIRMAGQMFDSCPIRAAKCGQEQLPFPEAGRVVPARGAKTDLAATPAVIDCRFSADRENGRGRRHCESDTCRVTDMGTPRPRHVSQSLATHATSQSDLEILA